MILSKANLHSEYSDKGDVSITELGGILFNGNQVAVVRLRKYSE